MVCQTFKNESLLNFNGKIEALNKRDIINKAVEKHGKLLAIEGKFEKPEAILKNMYIPEYKLIKYGESKKNQRRMANEFDVVFIGCAGKNNPSSAYLKIQDYVRNNGGWVITTDWAVKFILEEIFPGYVRWNKIRTDDAVGACHIIEPNHRFLDGVLSEIQKRLIEKKNIMQKN